MRVIQDATRIVTIVDNFFTLNLLQTVMDGCMLDLKWWAV